MTVEEAVLNDEADIDIVHRVLGGDPDAYRELILEYQGPLFGFVGRILPHREDREDVVQEAFLAAFAGLGSFDARKGTFAAWIFRIARNLALNARKKRTPSTISRLPEPESAQRPEPEVFLALDQALANLPAAQRSAFELAELHGFTYEEVAGIEGIRLGTVRSRIGRAREKLRAALEPYREARR